MKIIFTLIAAFIFGSVWLASSAKNPGMPAFAEGSMLTDSSPDTKPKFESSIIPQPEYLLAAHSATITHLVNGNLIALWFAGSHEGKPDVKIWQSIYTNGVWSTARAVVSPQMLTQAEGMYIRKVGNPVVYCRLDGTLDLFVTSVSIGGWSGSRINHLVSHNNGSSWQVVGKLKLSPFFNVSTLIRTKGVPLADGGFYLPVYYEMAYTYPELLRFDKDGNFIRKTRINSDKHLLQPSLIALSDEIGYAYFRNAAHSKQHVLMLQITDDAGDSWGNLINTNITNYDSSLVVERLKPGLFMMVRNVGLDRSKLVLSVSHNGLTWQDLFYLEHKEGYRYEFSYPAITVNGDTIDILYTWERKAIKHVRFNQAWLALQLAKNLQERGSNAGA